MKIKRKIMTLVACGGLAITITGCQGLNVTPKESPNPDVKPGPGLLTGDTGSFEIMDASEIKQNAALKTTDQQTDKKGLLDYEASR